MEIITKMAELQMHPAAAIDWASLMRKHYALACGIIKRRMPRCLRARYDPEDFVGEAIVELMANRARFVEFGPDLLILIAKRRMIDAARSPQSRMMPLDEDLIDRQPSVALEDDAAVLRESMLGRAGNSGDRAVVDLRCQGYTLPEIAERTGRGLRSVQRFFKDFTEANEPY
jgi:DNA-directed RNA polymerase specialized sigma24 family protein